MYNSEHYDFIVSPLIDILKNGLTACKGVEDSIASFPMSDDVLKSLFLKMTGAQEQKMKCILWDIATIDYEFRYKYLKDSNKYGECSSYGSKNLIYKTIIDKIKNLDNSFNISQIFDVNKLKQIIKEIKEISDNTIISIWQKREYDFYKTNYSKKININQIAKDTNLFESSLQDVYEKVVYKHRNKCAHNTLSYQRNKPDLKTIAEDDYGYQNYYFRYTLIIIIDSIFMALYKKYTILQPNRY
ncbi:MAG: hypothetical protein J6X31_07590 [Bacteroidales bacterium]|nr:hypothetical protein [Bacteroidales bacterium]